MAVNYQDYYRDLGIDRSATDEEVRTAYRELARRYHPDVSKEPDAEQRFKAITEAYEVLKDPEKRQRYDSLGSAWQNGQEFEMPRGWENVHFEFDGGGADGGFSDFFSSLFGGAPGFGQRATPQRRGRDVEAELPLTLAEVAQGGTRSLTLQTSTGEQKQYDVRIPPGVGDGSRIRLGGQGTAGRAGGPDGDLLLRIKLAPDPRFELVGQDLRTQVDIAPWEAVLGAVVEVESLGGRIDLTVPAGSQTGQLLRLRGLGLPRTADEKGDLIVRLRVVVPTAPGDEERKLYRELGEKSAFRPRGTKS